MLEQRVHHEESDVKIGPIFGFAFGLIVGGAAIFFVVWLLFGYFAAHDAATAVRQYPLAATEETRLPPEPRLQTNPRQDLKDLREEEDRVLNGFRWVDKSAGIVRIPIDQAMRLTLERGLPTRPSTEQGKP